MTCPEGWTILNEELWHLPVREAATLWGGVCRSQWVRPVLLRQSVSLMGRLRVTDDLLGRVCAPAVLVAVLEDLMREGFLRRAYVTALEETIFRYVRADGCWRGDPEGTGAPARCHPPDIVTLADTGRP